jgi:hypothetical protein
VNAQKFQAALDSAPVMQREQAAKQFSIRTADAKAPPDDDRRRPLARARQSPYADMLRIASSLAHQSAQLIIPFSRIVR